MATLLDDAMTNIAYADELRPRHRWTVADYHKMGETGVLARDARVELVEGEIIEMAPIGSGHAGRVKRLNDLLSSRLHGKAIVSVQDPVVLGDRSELQPDIAVLRWRADYYASAHPQPADVLLVIEVADTTVRYDREVKIPLYARHGIPEAWLLDLPGRRLEVYRSPHSGGYARVDCHRQGQVSAGLLSEAVVDLAGLFPNP